MSTITIDPGQAIQHSPGMKQESGTFFMVEHPQGEGSAWPLTPHFLAVDPPDPEYPGGHLFRWTGETEIALHFSRPYDAERVAEWVRADLSPRGCPNASVCTVEVVAAVGGAE